MLAISGAPGILAVPGATYSTEFFATGGTGPYTWSTNVALPGGLALTPASSPAATAMLAGTFTAPSGDYPFVVIVTDSTGATASIYVPLVIAAALTVSAAGAPADVYVGSSTPYTITAAGGIPPYSFTQTGNVSGLSLVGSGGGPSLTGIVNGNPVLAGVKNPVYTVTDSVGQTATVTQTITCLTGPALINANFPATGTTGAAYSGLITLVGHATGTQTPSVHSGSLPPGLALSYNSANKMISLTGEPTASGTFTFVIASTASGIGGTVLSASITIVVSQYFGPKFYNCLLPSLASAATTPIAALRVINWKVLHADIHDTLAGASPTATFSILNPGAVGLINSVGQWMLYWQETSPGVMKILAFGKLLGLPDGFASLGAVTTVDIECRPDDWEVQLLQLCNEYQLDGVENNGLINFVMDGLFYDGDRGPSLSDFADATIMVPCINRMTLAPVMQPAVAWVDVDPTRAAGNFASTYAGYVYDLTSLMTDFNLKKSQSNPLYAMTSKLAVAWDQRWYQYLDITGQIILAGGWSDAAPTGSAGLGKMTYAPDPLISSCPQKGSSAGTGWSWLTVVTETQYGAHTFNRPTTEAAVAAVISAGGEVISPGGTATITAQWAFVQPYQWVAYGDYHQRRNETVTVASMLDLQTLAIRASAPLLGSNVNVSDPTVDPDGTPWQPYTTYTYNDVVWYGGDREFCIIPHTSTGTFDPTKWLTFATENADLSGTVPVPWTAGMTTTAGELVTKDDVIYVANNTGATNPGFLPNDFSPAPIEYILPWYEFNQYPIGCSVRVSGQVYYCIASHFAATTWLADSIYWVPGTAAVLPMTPASPFYFAGPRGAVSIAHQGCRHFAKLLKQSKCMVATCRVPYGASIGNGLLTQDLLPGTAIRLRTPKIPGGVQEVIGVLSDYRCVIDGAKGTGWIYLEIGLVPGNGVANWVAGTTTMLPAVPTSGYTFEEALQPIAVNLLGSPPYVVLNASVTGANFSTVDAEITAAVAASTDGGSLQTAVKGLMDANPPSAKVQLRPLIQVDLIPLHHSTLTTQLLAAPKNISLQ